MGMRAITAMAALAAALVLAPGCGGSGGGDAATPSRAVPRSGAGLVGPTCRRGGRRSPPAPFVRGDPLTDPTRLVITAPRGRHAGVRARALASTHGIRVTGRASARERTRAGSAIAGGRRTPLPPSWRSPTAAPPPSRSWRGPTVAGLVRTVLLPVLDGFAPGAPDPPRSVLADEVPDPAYWPTAAWRTRRRSRRGWTAPASRRWSRRSG